MFEVGSIFGRLGAKFDKDGFEKFDRAAKAADRKAAELERKTSSRNLGPGEKSRKAWHGLGSDSDKSAAKVQRSASRIGGSATKMGSTVAKGAKVAAVGLAALGVGAVFAGKKIVDLASDAAETDSKLQVTFGKRLPQVTKELDDFAGKTAASRTELRTYAADLGALVQPMGLSRKEAARMSVDVSKLAVDLGSFNNVPTDQALQAIRSGLVGESEPLRAFGVNLNEAAIKAEAMSAGLVKAEVDTRKVALAQEKAKLAGLNLSQAVEKYGKNSEQARRANIAFQSAQDGYTKATKGSIPTLDAATKAQAAWNIIQKQTKLAQGDATRTAGSAANQFKELKSQLTDIGVRAGTVLLPAVTKVVSFINKNIPTVVDTIVSFKDEATAAWDAVSTAVVDSWDDIQAAGQAVMDWYSENIQPTLEAVAHFWHEHSEDVMRVVDGIVIIVQTFLENIRSIFNALMAVVRGDWSTAWNEIKSIPVRMVKAGIALIKTLWPVARNAGKDLAKRAVEGLDDLRKNAPGAIRQAISAGLKAIREYWPEAKTRAIALAKQALAGLGEGLGNLAEWMGKKLAELGVALTDPKNLAAVGGFAVTVGEKILSSIVSGLTGIGGAIKEKVKTEVQSQDWSGILNTSLIDLFRAGGGFVPGDPGRGDVVPVMATAGEVVLNKKQQRMLGPARILSVLAATGGKLSGYASGGVIGSVQNALKFGRAQLGDIYSQGGARPGRDPRRPDGSYYPRTGPDGWDCSGFASVVASKIPGFSGPVGGTTYTLYPRTVRNATDRDPVAFGFRSRERNGWGHMGIRILGQWLDAGTGGVQAGDSRWDTVRVPGGFGDLWKKVAPDVPNGPIEGGDKGGGGIIETGGAAHTPGPSFGGHGTIGAPHPGWGGGVIGPHGPGGPQPGMVPTTGGGGGGGSEAPDPNEGDGLTFEEQWALAELDKRLALSFLDEPDSGAQIQALAEIVDWRRGILARLRASGAPAHQIADAARALTAAQDDLRNATTAAASGPDPTQAAELARAQARSARDSTALSIQSAFVRSVGSGEGLTDGRIVQNFSMLVPPTDPAMLRVVADAAASGANLQLTRALATRAVG